MKNSKGVIFGLLAVFLCSSVAYAEKPKWVENKNAAKKAGETTDWKGQRDQWKASKPKDSDNDEAIDKDKAKNKAQNLKDKALQKAENGKSKKGEKVKGMQQERDNGKPDMQGKMDDKPMKELDKGSDKGLESRQERKKWWQFW